VNGTLSTGETFSATVGSKFAGNYGDKGKSALHSRVRPNPINPSTVVTFTLSQPGKVRVLIYDLQGRLVKTLLDEKRSAGDQTVTWNGSNSRSNTVPSGVYFVRIQAPQGEEVQRVTVLK
jgi:flagellar hook assembly protein FlgD